MKRAKRQSINDELKAIESLIGAINDWLNVDHGQPISKDTLGILAIVSNLKATLAYRSILLKDELKSR
jgi:hypothetical protein